MDGHERPVVFAMDGATRIGEDIARWIGDNWIDGFTLAEREEWRRHDREGYSLAKQNVRGRKVYVITSFASDDVTGAFAPDCAKQFRIKVKKQFMGTVPVGVVGIASWENEDHSVVRLKFGDDPCVDLPRDRFDRHLHVLGETVDEKIWGAINFIHSLKDASAGDVTLIATMLPYTRQDEKDQPRAGIYTATFVNQMQAAGVKRIITMDVHSRSSLQNACSVAKVRFDHLEARCLLAKAAIRHIPEGARVVVCAPDVGASKRGAPDFHQTISGMLGRPVGFAIALKDRMGDTETELTTIIEDPRFPIGPAHAGDDGAYVISPDDILATGSTFRNLEEAVRNRGGILAAVCCSHWLFTGKPVANLAKVPRIIGTRTVEPWRVQGTPIEDKLEVVDVAGVFARAIKETHQNGSINGIIAGLEQGEIP